MFDGLAPGIGVMTVVVFLVTAWRLKLFIDERIRTPRFVCPVCRTLMVHATRGYAGWIITGAIWFTGLVAAIILSRLAAQKLALAVSWVIWFMAIVYLFISERHIARRCSTCHAMGVLPIDSRRGEEIVGRLYEEFLEVEREMDEIYSEERRRQTQTPAADEAGDADATPIDLEEALGLRSVAGVPVARAVPVATTTDTDDQGSTMRVVEVEVEEPPEIPVAKVVSVAASDPEEEMRVVEVEVEEPPAAGAIPAATPAEPDDGPATPPTSESASEARAAAGGGKSVAAAAEPPSPAKDGSDTEIVDAVPMDGPPTAEPPRE